MLSKNTELDSTLMTKKITFSLLAIIISGCVLISTAMIVGALYLVKAQKNYIPPTADPVDLLCDEEKMDLIQEQVSVIRGLNLSLALDREMMSTSELEYEVSNEFFKDYSEEDVQQDVRLLSVLGLLEPDFDLLQFYKDLYSEQVAGYYDSETKEMKVIADGGFRGLERMTYAHEFTHALQDQNYDLENGLMLNDETCERDSEYCAAVTALIEGDATLTEQYWFLQHSTNRDKSDVSDFQFTFESPIFDSAPAFMRLDFLFPYQEGMNFVNALYADQKWDSVDAAYQELPVSTEQILHPEKYPYEKPIRVDMRDLSAGLGPEWVEKERNQMGEWYTYLILSQGYDPAFRLSDISAFAASEGWGGDLYLYYENQDTSSYYLVWLSAWDTPYDAQEFFSSSREYGILRWGETLKESENSLVWQSGDGFYCEIEMDGNQTLWVISNDAQAAQRVDTKIKNY